MKFGPEFQYSPSAISVILSYFLLAFSPLTSFVLSVLCLLFNPKSKRVRLALYLPILISLSLLIVSRELFITFKDDFQTYYENYLNIINGDGFNRFGIEYGFLFFNYLIGFISGEMPPRLLLLVYVLFQLLLLFVFFELAIKRFSINDNPNLLIAVVLITLPFLSFSVVIRQNISLILLAMSIIRTSNLSKYLLLILASSFHLTAFVVYFLYHAIVRLSKFSACTLIVFSIIVFFTIDSMLPFIEGLPKIRAFFVGDTEFDLIVFIIYYKLIFLCLFLNFFLKSKETLNIRKQLLLLLYFAFLLDVFAPYISFRVFQLALLFSGCILFYHISRFKKFTNKLILSISVCFLLLFIKLSTFFMVNNEYSIMKSYPAYSFQAFYYLDEILVDINRRGRDY